MSSIKIERMDVKNTQRGKAYFLARFDVNFGPMTIKGFELVKAGDQVFISAPYNLWKPKDANPQDKPQKFTYVWFNDDKGKKLEEMISQMAKEEYRRRNSAPPPQPEQNAWAGGDDMFGGGGGNQGGGNQGGGDGLPF